MLQVCKHLTDFVQNNGRIIKYYFLPKYKTRVNAARRFPISYVITENENRIT